MTIGIYAKAVAGSVVAGMTAALTALDDGTITGPEWAGIASVAIAALVGVWAVPNTPAGVAKYGKAITAAAVAGFGAAGTALTDGTITPAEWITIVIAVAGAAGVTYTVPNTDWSDGLA